MHQIINPAIELQVIDFVLDPFKYQEALSTCAKLGQLAGETINHLAMVLPLAVAQLDAIGDVYGGLALARLRDQLTQLESLA
jgi:hypothetical protein